MNENVGPFVTLIDALENDGLPTAAKKLDFLLRDVIWNSNVEFLDAFGVEMEKTKRSYWERMSSDTRAAYGVVAQLVWKPESGE